MLWSLFIIIAGATNWHAAHVDNFKTMEACFMKREEIVKQYGEPVLNNYQAVCVTKKQKGNPV